MLNMQHALALLVLCSFGVSGLYAQAVDQSYFRFTYANDYFRATDYYYTQGVRLEYGRGAWLGFFSREGYTPTSITRPEILRGDRPYAGVTYFGLRQNSTLPATKGLLSLEAILGFMGPASGGKQEQTFIHRITDNREPQGWDNQLANDLILNLHARYDQLLVDLPYASVHGGGEIRLGTYRTRAGLHAQIELGVVQARATKRGNWSLLFRVVPQTFYAAYDATLTGGVLNDSSPYTLAGADLKRFVGRISTGAHLRINRLGLAFTHSYSTREWNSGRPHAWGAISIIRYTSRSGTIAPPVWSMP